MLFRSCYLDVRTRDGEIAYWRTQTGLEVDFVVGSCAIEAKSTDNVGKGDLKGLKAIGDEGGVVRRVLVCREPVSRVVDGIEILSVRDFIDRLWSDQLNLV